MCCNDSVISVRVDNTSTDTVPIPRLSDTQSINQYKKAVLSQGEQRDDAVNFDT